MNNSKPTGLSTGAKIGIALLVFVVIGAIVGGAIYMVVSKKNNSMPVQPPPTTPSPPKPSIIDTVKDVAASVVPALLQTRGRYIKLTNPVTKTCYRMGEIKVYSTIDGINIITPSTKVTSTSVLSDRGVPDAYPAQNLVNGNGASFAHTTCDNPDTTTIAANKDGGIRGFTVDLGLSVPIAKIVLDGSSDYIDQIIGTVLTILDENNNVVYTARAIPSLDGVYGPNNTMGHVKRFWTYTLPSTAPVGSDVP